MNKAAIDFEEIDASGLLQICEQGWHESQFLDFKRTLPSKSDKDRSEFMKDVCAFANADGGDLLFGVDARDGQARALAPIAEESSDAAMMRLGQILESGVEPRLRVQFRPVPVEKAGYVLLVRVPASFDGPHRYTVNGISRFVTRSETHTSELTYQQLRMAFDRTSSLVAKARQFRAQRLVEIRSGASWAAMREGPLCVVHVLPMGAMTGRSDIDVAALHRDRSKFATKDWFQGGRPVINLDGAAYFVRDSAANVTLAYTLIFRSGVIESVRWAGLTIDYERRTIPSRTLAEFVREAIAKFSGVARDVGLGGPGIIGVSFLNVTGFTFAMKSRREATPDRAQVVLPELWMESLGDIDDADRIAKPLLDVLWQAYGEESCDLYDSEGRWAPGP